MDFSQPSTMKVGGLLKGGLDLYKPNFIERNCAQLYM